MIFSKGEREDDNIINHIMIFAVAVVSVVLSGYFIREFDWISTSKFFDGMGWQELSTQTQTYLGNVVSLESYVLNLSIYLCCMLFLYLSYISGPVFRLSLGEWVKSSWTERFGSMNYRTISLLACMTSLSALDSAFDFLYKIDGNFHDREAVLGALFVSFIFYGVLSEWMLGASAKIVLTSGFFILDYYSITSLFGYKEGRSPGRRKRNSKKKSNRPRSPQMAPASTGSKRNDSSHRITGRPAPPLEAPDGNSHRITGFPPPPLSDVERHEQPRRSRR